MMYRGVLVPRNDPFHFIFKVEFDFFQISFLEQILGAEINRVRYLFQLQLAQGMLL
jgi:hypothetical protein